MSVKTLVIAIVALAFNFGISQDAFAQGNGKGKAKGHYKHANKKAVKKNKHDKDIM